MEHLIQNMVENTATWLNGQGDDSDIIISSRIRLARNLQNFPFVNRATENDLEKSVQLVLETSKESKAFQNAIYVDGAALKPFENQFFTERRLISAKFSEKFHARGFLFTEDEHLDLMINEEDHLRIQILSSGFNLHNALQKIQDVDQNLSETLDYAWSDEFGFLTACPTNVGTGIRFSVFIHLPVLTLEKKVSEIFQETIPAGIAIRGFYGEGSKVIGNFFQISNQYTLGITEQEILNKVLPIIRRIIDTEREARDKALNEKPIFMEDKVYRTLGILSNARLLSSFECIELLSALHLGIDLGLIDTIKKEILNELMVITQPAHIQAVYGEELKEIKRDQIRAELVKERLKLQSLYS